MKWTLWILLCNPHTAVCHWEATDNYATEELCVVGALGEHSPIIHPSFEFKCKPDRAIPLPKPRPKQ